MFGKRKARITELEAEAERLGAEVEQLQAKSKRAKEALRRKEDEVEQVMERMQKERRISAAMLANPRRGNELARDAINLVRYGPLFDHTDPSVPRYSREQVEQEMRRIVAELEQ